MEKTVKALHEERKEMWEASILNHKRYIDNDTGLFKAEYVEYRDCPVCGQKEDIEIFLKEGGRYVKCKSCNMVYINPVFTDDALHDYYQMNHDIQSKVVESDTAFYADIYNLGLNRIEQVHIKGSILDIGCSSGVFLDVAKKRGWGTCGVELNKQEVAYARQKGHVVYNELLEHIHFDKEFDAICMWDVFEHIKNGEFYLNKMKNLLAKNGVIFLQIPSSDSLAAKILQEKCNMFDGLEHVNLYGVGTIKKLAEKCNLKVLNISTVISEIGVVNNYLNYEDPYLGSTTNKTDILNLVDEKTMHENLLGYKLQVVLGGNS